MEEQFKRALYNGNLILDHVRWHNNFYIKIVDGNLLHPLFQTLLTVVVNIMFVEITVDEFRAYVQKMLREIHIEGILHGNITEEVRIIFVFVPLSHYARLSSLVFLF